MDYRREIDGLRSFAVLPVVLFHAGFATFGGGYVGVDIFFVISGYLISTIIFSELAQGKFSLLNFYERRARRILPALFFVVLVSWLLAWALLLPSDMKEFSESIVAVFTFVSNILFWRTSGYFDADTELKPLLHTWSLALEEQYYVFFPVALMGLWRFGRKAVWLVLVAATVLSFAAAQWGSLNDPTAAFYLLPTRGWELLFGAMAALLLAKRRIVGFRPGLDELGSATGLLLIGWATLMFNKDTPFPGVYALAPTLGATLIILCATPHTVVGRLLGSRILVMVGLVSYSTYLWHQPLLAFARHFHEGEPTHSVMSCLVALSVILGYLTWRYVEQPFRDRRRFARKSIFVASAGFSAAFILLGVFGMSTSGFASRYQEGEDRQLATLQKRVVGRYVSRRFNALALKAFDPADSRRRVLIIGDSFAQDLVNAVAESPLNAKIQMSTRHIGHLCGNLFLPRATFELQIRPDAVRSCDGKGIFEDARLRQLMQSADEVWFASRWQLWQAPLVQKSLVELKAATGKSALVFGRKDFGQVNIKALLRLAADQRRLLKGDVTPEVLQVNAQLRSVVAADAFVDVQSLLCGPDEKLCAQVDRELGLVSHDGGHLTEAGAKLLGRQLAERALVRATWGHD